MNARKTLIERMQLLDNEVFEKGNDSYEKDVLQHVIAGVEPPEYMVWLAIKAQT